MAMPASAPAPAPRWRNAWIGWRNRLIADPRFQRWAASSILTRFVARRRARALFDLCAGFVYSQILLACVRLRLCEILAEGPRELDGLARQMALSPDAARRLLRAAASLGLVRALPDDTYALADLGAALIGNPSIADIVEHHELLYDDLRDPVALLRGETRTRLSGFWPYAADQPGQQPARSSTPDEAEACARYSALMSRSQALVAEDILDAFPLHGHRSLLDIGGGEGTFLAAVAARTPGLGLELFDLPEVVACARRKLGASGLGGRVTLHGGSFLLDAIPAGADVVTLVRILHDHDDFSVRTLLASIHASLPPGGTLLVAEPMSGAAGAAPIGDAYFGFYLLAMGRGRARTPTEISALLKEAGFSNIREIPTRRPLLTSMIIARRV
jgi:demethylspheroidene O-methyltransferase